MSSIISACPHHQTIAMTAQESLITVLNTCDNFRPHLSQEPLVPPSFSRMRPAPQ